MKRFQHYCFLLLAIVVVGSSCKKSVPVQTKYIPKESMIVLDLNWKSITQKTADAHINVDSIVRSMDKDPDTDSLLSSTKQKFREFMQSGIDTTEDVFVFVKTGGSIMAGQSTTVGVIAKMKDASAFEAYVKKLPVTGGVQKADKYSYISLQNNTMLGWNDEVAIVNFNENTNYDYSDNSTPQKSTTTQQLEPLFNLKSEDAVTSIPQFADLMKEKGDILMWNNSSGMLSSIPFLGMTKIADLLKDSYSTTVVNFDNGKIVADMKSYSGKDLADIWNKYKGPEANMDLVNKYPYPVEGYAAFSFNPQVIMEILKYSGFEPTARQYLDKEGVSLDDFIKIFKGDFAIVFSDIAEKEVTYGEGEYQFKGKQPTAKLIFNATIADKDAYNRIAAKLAGGEDPLMEMKDGNYVPRNLKGMAFSMDGKNLLIATDSTLLQEYLAGKGNASIPSDIASKSKGKAFTMYIDIAKILNGFTVGEKNQNIMNAAKATFNNVTAGTENYNGKYVAGSFQVNMVNQQENSLTSLVKFMSTMMQEVNLSAADNGGMSDLDMPPAPDSTDDAD